MVRLIVFVSVIVLVSMLALHEKEEQATSVPVLQKEIVRKDEKAKPESRLLVVPVKMVKVQTPAKPEPKPEPETVPEEKKQKQEADVPAPQPAQHPNRAGEESPQGTEGDQDPAVLANYGMPVTDYLQYMLRHGARVGLYNTKTGIFVCSLNSNGSFGGSIRQSGMSPRARRITTDFPRSQEILQQARQRFGSAHYEILLLVPKAVDDRFYQNISRVIHEVGRSKKNVSMVRVTYRGSAGSVKVAVDKLEGKGGPMQLNRTFFM